MPAVLSFFHLTVFEAMFRLKSVSLAAEALEIPQPTLSRHLQFLRDHFKDPLFVRTKTGMEATSIALSAKSAVTEALEIYRTRLSGESHFDPAESQREFIVAASDVGHALVLSWLVDTTRDTAPYIKFKAVPLSREKLISRLQAGEIDLAIGSFPNLYAGVREQTLWHEHYVCVVPRTLAPDGRLSLAQFKAAEHVMVEGHLLGHIHQEVEKKIIQLVGHSHMKILTESFSAAAHICERSDLIFTTPSRAAEFADPEKVFILKPPVTLPEFDVKQYWHERFDHDAGNIWLRGLIAKMRRNTR